MGLGTFWVIAPDVVAAPDLFPLNDGDMYRYDTGLIINVSWTSNEPNLPNLLAKVAFTRRTPDLGRLSEQRPDHRPDRAARLVRPDLQEVLTPPALLIGARDAVGFGRAVISSYQGYRPFGSTQPSYQGTVETSTADSRSRGHDRPAWDVRHGPGPVTTRFSDDRPAFGEEEVVFWFAKGIGPVQIQLPGAAQPAHLVELSVGGITSR
jgi:hypothetical protein